MTKVTLPQNIDSLLGPGPQQRGRIIDRAKEKEMESRWGHDQFTPVTLIERIQGTSKDEKAAQRPHSKDKSSVSSRMFGAAMKQSTSAKLSERPRVVPPSERSNPRVHSDSKARAVRNNNIQQSSAESAPLHAGNGAAKPAASAIKMKGTSTPGPVYVWVSNLDDGTTEADVKAVFAQKYTSCEEAVLNPPGSKPITVQLKFTDKNQALMASLEFNGLEADGKILSVEIQTSAKLAKQLEVPDTDMDIDPAPSKAPIIESKGLYSDSLAPSNTSVAPPKPAKREIPRSPRRNRPSANKPAASAAAAAAPVRSLASRLGIVTSQTSKPSVAKNIKLGSTSLLSRIK